MGENYDRFGDIDAKHRGLFGSDQPSLHNALERLESCYNKLHPEGLVLEFECEGCSTCKQMIVTWPELVALRWGLNPAVAFRGQRNILDCNGEWEPVPEEHSWRPVNCKCDRCPFHLAIRIGSGEPQKYIGAGLRLGFLHPAAEQQLSGIAQQVAAAIRQQSQQRR